MKIVVLIFIFFQVFINPARSAEAKSLVFGVSFINPNYEDYLIGSSILISDNDLTKWQNGSVTNFMRITRSLDNQEFVKLSLCNDTRSNAFSRGNCKTLQGKGSYFHISAIASLTGAMDELAERNIRDFKSLLTIATLPVGGIYLKVGQRGLAAIAARTGLMALTKNKLSVSLAFSFLADLGTTITAEVVYELCEEEQTCSVDRTAGYIEKSKEIQSEIVVNGVNMRKFSNRLEAYLRPINENSKPFKYSKVSLESGEFGKMTNYRASLKSKTALREEMWEIEKYYRD